MPAFLLGNLADFKILLQCYQDDRILRMKLRDNESLEAKKRETLIREESERQRFIEIYQIDIQDPQLIQQTFNAIIDTTSMTISEVTEKSIQLIEQKFPKLKQLV
jgi:CMP/dCMP kinase